MQTAINTDNFVMTVMESGESGIIYESDGQDDLSRRLRRQAASNGVY